MPTRQMNLPSRFWFPERNMMYEIVSRMGTRLEILINKRDNLTIMVEESEGDRMDWTGRRDCNGDDIYTLDILRNLTTGEICLVQKLCDKIRCTEFITCLEHDNAVIESLPFDMSKYERLGDYYRDKVLVPDKLK